MLSNNAGKFIVDSIAISNQILMGLRNLLLELSRNIGDFSILSTIDFKRDSNGAKSLIRS